MVDYSPRLPPRQHQEEALARLGQRPCTPSSEDVFAYLCEMGTGKTYMILREWGEGVVAGCWDSLLLIAPAGVYRNWAALEVPKHLGEPVASQLVQATWESGGGVAKQREIVRLLTLQGSGCPRALFMNHEALATVPRALEVATLFLRTGRAMLVVDESTLLKGPESKITSVLCGGAWRKKFFPGLRKLAVARRIASGLVTPQNPLDLYSQFAFLDPRILGHQNYHTFRARYAVTQSVCFLKTEELWGYLYRACARRGVEPPFGLDREALLAELRRMNVYVQHATLDVGFRNQDELSERIAPYSYRVLKDQCLDLPPKEYTVRHVDMPPEQSRLYRELRDQATSELESGHHISADSVIEQCLRLQQLLCGDAVDEEGVEHEVPELRTAALMALLADCEGKALVWVPWRRPLARVSRAIRKVYGEESVVEFHGGTPGRLRPEVDRRFQEDPKVRFCVGTQGAGGLARTLTAASLVVYYANNWRLDHRLQSEDRAHRDGLTHAVTYVDLIARGTVDEKIVAALREKLNLASAITRDGYRRWLV